MTCLVCYANIYDCQCHTRRLIEAGYDHHIQSPSVKDNPEFYASHNRTTERSKDALPEDSLSSTILDDTNEAPGIGNS